MPESDPTFRPPRLATSEDIPRAIEYLIQRVLRFAGFGISAVLGMVAFSAFWHGWSLWVVTPALTLAGMAFMAAISIRPRGEIIFDNHGPIIVVPCATPSAVNNSGDNSDQPPSTDHP